MIFTLKNFVSWSYPLKALDTRRDESRPLGLKSHLGRRSRCTGEASLGRHLSNGKGRQACSGPRTKQRSFTFADVMHHCKYQILETPSKRKYKGRLVFEEIRFAIHGVGLRKFGAMFSTPTNIQAINLAIYYGLLAGNVLRAADCTSAFLQAMLPHEEEDIRSAPP